MGTCNSWPTIRVTFTDYFPDPDDDDCLRRAVTLRADRLTFEDEHLALWLADVEVERYPLTIVTSVTFNEAADSSERADPEVIRAQYPNAYAPWSTEDEERLLSLYREGTRDFGTLGTEFGRQPSAIRSRLAKLGLEQL